MPLGEVADVDENIADGVGKRDRVDQRAGARPLLVHREGVVRAVGVAGCVGAALGDPSEQRLRDSVRSSREPVPRL